MLGMVVVLLMVIGIYHYETASHQEVAPKRTTSIVHRRKLASHNHQLQRGSLKRAHYQIKPIKLKTQKVIKQVKLDQQPGRNPVGNTLRLLSRPRRFTNLVQINQIAIAKNEPSEYHISRQGKSLGWIPVDAVQPTRQYMLPYVYISQFWPSKADDACEIASLKTALSTKNKAMNVPLRTMVQRIPRTQDPNTGYTNDPYRYGSHATIYPDAMVKIAKEYGANVRNITGATKSQFINAVEHGHAVVFEGPYMMKKPYSDHDLVILGYRPGYFFVADPFARHVYSPRTTWVSTSKLMRLFNKKFRHQRALVIE